MDLPEGSSRQAMILEYNGSVLQGFQKQSNTPHTVQAHLEKSISNIANVPLTVTCAGRTDAGVHATQQVLHFDTPVIRSEKAWIEGVNTKLPDGIRVRHAQQVAPQFHARFSALSRTYRYVIYSDRTQPALLNKLVTWSKYAFREELMQEAAQALVGEHDFSAFRASQCQAHSPNRHIQYVRFKRDASFLVMEIRANAFLHHMVRNIIGSLMVVGRGQRPVSWISELLDGKDRNKAAATASPYGLYFVAVEYEGHLRMAAEPTGPDFLR